MPEGVPNYLLVNPDGTVTAEFSGGVAMPLQPGSPVPDDGSSVAWETGPGGARLAYIVGTRSNVSGQVTANLIARDADPATRTAQIRAVATPSTDNASLRISAQDSNTLAGELILLDSETKSDFLQIGNSRKSATRTITFTWPGGSPQSNILNLATIFGFTVEGFTAGINDDNKGFLTIVQTNVPAGIIAATACNSSLGAVVPIAGATNKAFVTAWST